MIKGKLKAYRKKLRIRYILYFMLPEKMIWMRQKAICLDIGAVLRYDRLKQKDMCTPFPILWTDEGWDMFQHLLKLYGESRPMEMEQYRKQLLQSGGWRCTCGRANPDYTATCACGKNKRDVPQKVKYSPAVATWNCPCGRENPAYTSTCVCGKNKRDANS